MSLLLAEYCAVHNGEINCEISCLFFLINILLTEQGHISHLKYFPLISSLHIDTNKKH